MQNSPSYEASLLYRRDKRGPTIQYCTLKRPTVQDKMKIFEGKMEGISKEKIELLQKGGLLGLVHLKHSEHIRVQAIVPQIINSIVVNESTGAVTLLDEVAWKSLYELCGVKELEIRRDAVWTVAILAGQPDAQDHIIKTFGWRSILKLTQNDDPDLKMATSILIGNLASTKENQMALISHGGLKILMEQAQAIQDLEVRRATATALANAVVEDEGAKLFTEEGGLDLLKVLLKQKDKELTDIVLSTVANLSSGDNPEINDRLVKEVGLEVLVDSLSENDSKLRRSSAIAIGHLSSQDTHRIKLAELQVINKMANLLKAEPVEDNFTLGGVAMTFKHFSQDPRTHKQIRNLLDLLKELIKVASPELQAEIEKIIENLKKFGDFEPISNNNSKAEESYNSSDESSFSGSEKDKDRSNAEGSSEQISSSESSDESDVAPAYKSNSSHSRSSSDYDSPPPHYKSRPVSINIKNPDSPPPHYNSRPGSLAAPNKNKSEADSSDDTHSDTGSESESASNRNLRPISIESKKDQRSSIDSKSSKKRASVGVGKRYDISSSSSGSTSSASSSGYSSSGSDSGSDREKSNRLKGKKIRIKIGL
eukprot:TRINITY_DN705_c0_g1_i5.p1 TRINITY_DN705_c0_g1~~TRINITY_DN705_c0_g1_i5.p1  ORF type:complete len:595 (-),score=112.16 TRINITY_DN705_c0_g1_i5:1503-3287(-)